MATTEELRNRIGKLTSQLQALEARERSKAIAEVSGLIKEYGIEAAALGLSVGKRKRVGSKGKVDRPAKFRDPKTGATWNGWGKPPNWLTKDPARREKYLISGPAAKSEEKAVGENQKRVKERTTAAATRLAGDREQKGSKAAAGRTPGVELGRTRTGAAKKRPTKKSQGRTGRQPSVAQGDGDSRT